MDTTVRGGVRASCGRGAQPGPRLGPAPWRARPPDPRRRGPAEISGRLRHEAAGAGELPTTGDWVAFHPSPGSRARIEAVLPRTTKFSRKAAFTESDEQVVAANVDSVFLVSSLNADLNARRLERYLTLAWESGASPRSC